MAESGIREIQLSGKQLAFLFMTTVVLLVGVFLLGVSVGRGAKALAAAPAPSDPAPTAEAPMTAPPGTIASPESLIAQGKLQGTAAAKPADSATPPAANPQPPAPPPASAAAPPSTHANDPAPDSKVAAPTKTSSPVGQTSKPAAAPTTTKTPAPAAGGRYVQVESFKSKDLADALVAKLKGKGLDAYIVDTPKPLNRVRVGPYPQRAAADAVALQLRKDGYSSPLVAR